MQTETIADFYQEHFFEGRAVLRGTAKNPDAWLVSIPGTRRYCICFADREDIWFTFSTSALDDLRLPKQENRGRRRPKAVEGFVIRRLQ